MHRKHSRSEPAWVVNGYLDRHYTQDTYLNIILCNWKDISHPPPPPTTNAMVHILPNNVFYLITEQVAVQTVAPL